MTFSSFVYMLDELDKSIPASERNVLMRFKIEDEEDKYVFMSSAGAIGAMIEFGSIASIVI